MKMKKGDKVIVITGKQKGEKGTITKVLGESNRVVVEGIAKAKVHQKARRSTESGSIIERERSVHTSNVMLVDPKSGSRTRVGKKKVGEKWQRFAKKSGQEL
ncbi:MAG TPA: 50S ribosomal protein L24 [Candidatus Paceibacterota bacterium]|nr:50S ribosomal protein L24 [Candidatus Paceibacterota bacterium]